MKTLQDFINESIQINESDPRGDFMVKKPFPTDFMWEYYAYVNNPSSLDEPEYTKEMVEDSNFEDFLTYAEKK